MIYKIVSFIVILALTVCSPYNSIAQSSFFESQKSSFKLAGVLDNKEHTCKKNSRQRAHNGPQSMFTSGVLNMMPSLKYG